MDSETFFTAERERMLRDQILRRGVTDARVLEAMRSTEPGAWEYQLDAVARYVFLQNGARLDGYRSITASGTDNIWNGSSVRASALGEGT